MAEQTTARLVEHFFRHESGKLIASLVRHFGLRHFDLVEDVVQSTLADALLAWKQRGVPENPPAWIHRVAKNRALDALRRDNTFREIAAQVGQEQHWSESAAPDFDESEIADSLLRMLFACCHPDLQAESAIPLTLKAVCGFGEQEIANCLLIPHATVRKRIYRAKRNLIEHDISPEIPSVGDLKNRLRVVHNVLYLMFNQGYSSSGTQDVIRIDVCEEAARLCHLLTEDSRCSTHATQALLALMLFHACRFGSRIDQQGALVLLEDQDRQLWDQALMRRAFDYFSVASGAELLSSYHLEAAIAMYHCSAPSFDETNWAAIVSLFDRLIDVHDSPIYKLNRAIAVGQCDGPRAALETLQTLQCDKRLRDFHLLDASLGEFYRRAGEMENAVLHFQSALKKTNSRAEQATIHKRIQMCR